MGTQKARHLTLTGCFGGHPCNVIIDTGATRTFVSDAWVKQHNVTSLLPSLGVHVQPAAGHNVHCMHECTFELQLGHWHAPVTALVFPGAHFDMLLGMDVLDAHDAILHAARRTLSMRVGGCRHTIFCRRLLALSMHTYAANGGRCTTASVLPSGDHPLPLALAQSSGPGLGHTGPLGSVATGPPPLTTHHPPPPILSSPCQPCKPPPSSGPGLGHSPPPLANHARPLDSVTAGPPPPPTGHHHLLPSPAHCHPVILLKLTSRVLKNLKMQALCIACRAHCMARCIPRGLVGGKTCCMSTPSHNRAFQVIVCPLAGAVNLSSLWLAGSAERRQLGCFETAPIACSGL